MTDIICSYLGDREEMLIAYLYDDIKPPERAAFEVHLTACAQCRSELAALGSVRAQLVSWAPPAPTFAGTLRESSVANRLSSVGSHSPRSLGGVWRGWRDMPAWAQVAAAMLVLGLSAGVANLDIRYDRNGLSVRTGWSSGARGVGGTRGAEGAPGTPGAAFGAPWRSDLAALEQQLRNEFHAVQVTSPSRTVPQGIPSVRSASSDAELMRRLKALVDDSERRQQRELALRVGEVVREVNSQRQADLRKIDQNIGLVQNRSGVEALRQREMLNYLVQRVSQR